ncbi:hypothetical protein [Poriferisphaera sp. WC338]|uniref:hypothetical protein n=1 Tax=Poriferisphaera sp. WC338 TaxID=3425129 RepID=UPI003D81482B
MLRVISYLIVLSLLACMITPMVGCYRKETRRYDIAPVFPYRKPGYDAYRTSNNRPKPDNIKREYPW